MIPRRPTALRLPAQLIGTWRLVGESIPPEKIRNDSRTVGAAGRVVQKDLDVGQEDSLRDLKLFHRRLIIKAPTHRAPGRSGCGAKHFDIALQFVGGTPEVVSDRGQLLGDWLEVLVLSPGCCRYHDRHGHCRNQKGKYVALCAHDASRSVQC